MTALVVLSAPAAGGDAPNLAKTARDWLAEALADTDKTKSVMAAFQTAGDDELIGVLAVLSRSGDREIRVGATAALGRIGKPAAVPFLIERLNRDPHMAIRAEAMAQLVKLNALSTQQLQQALAIPDENVQCIAARALARMGKGQLAFDALKKLTGSSDTGTAALSRMSLLGLGDSSQMSYLRKVLSDPDTPDALLGMLMEQVTSEKIQWAQPLAVQMAESGGSGPVRLAGYKALAALNPHCGPVLLDAIRKAKGTVMRVHVLHVLALCKDARAHLEALAKEPDAVGALARFELARPQGGAQAVDASKEALALGHPVVAEYLLNRAQKEADADPKAAVFYVPILLDLAASVPTDPRAMGKQHIHAAQGVTLIAKLDDPAGLAGLKKLLAGRHSAVVLTVAAGLRWSKNPAVCDLMAGLLNSGYEELVIDAAMTLGYFGRREATAALLAIVRNEKRHRPELVALACWYLAKMSGQGAQVAEDLIRRLK